MNVGSIVRYRKREWVVMPSDNPEHIRLRPLTGAADDFILVHKALSETIGYSLPDERITAARFPLPATNDVSDAASAHLLWQAARLSLREGATPFRSLGRISIRPRIYQFVPLLMALRLDPLRLLIADDVGVGKTIEALLIARELVDGGEVKRLAVLCPPYLCDQWYIELTQKFNLEAVIIRSGTINRLEREKPGPETVYRHYPFQVISIDFIKSDHNRHAFLQDCPELVIVDEAHGTALPYAHNTSQHQRHRLINDIASRTDRRLILLTATPHSGIEAAFQSLLGLLKPDFGAWPIGDLGEDQRAELARHFVQRTRTDIKVNWDGEDCFPIRDPKDECYPLSPAYRRLFDETYAFCTKIVQSGQTLEKRRQRVRFWGALALLRCVMSSPAAAVAAIENRESAQADVIPASDEGLDDAALYQGFVFESSDEIVDDSPPTPPIEDSTRTLPPPEKRKLRDLARLALEISRTDQDTKLSECAKLVAALLRKGDFPIVWCRYIATSDYVAEGLQKALSKEFPDVQVASITSSLGGDEERRAKIDELSKESRRVLVATDCLSEGINLQHVFNAVIHYDLPWNPNRLEQREGRVDRYGQKLSKTVRTIRYFSPDNPIDGIVIEVLLDKAQRIRKTLGTHVPVPDTSETVFQAILNALFLRGRNADGQLKLDLDVPETVELHRRWDIDAEREKINRTRFAQRAMKPEEVRRELESTDQVLGDPDAVRAFVLDAAQRLNLPITADPRKKDIFRVAVGREVRAILPEAVNFVLPETRTNIWLISFVSPTPEGADYIGRNHRFVATLAQYLVEEALTKGSEAKAARCGVIQTRMVACPTILGLLRARYLINHPDQPPALAEEVLTIGWESPSPERSSLLTPEAALALLANAKPDANVPLPEKRSRIDSALAFYEAHDKEVKTRLDERAAELLESHRRIRQSVSLKIRNLSISPQIPPDLLGLVVYLPMERS